MASVSHNHIAFPQPGAMGRPVGFQRNYQDAARDGKAVLMHEPALERDVLSCNADVTPTDFVVSYQQTRDVLCRVYGDGEAEPLRRQDHGGIYTDNFSARGDERTTGVARVERRIGLDHVVDKPPGVRSQRAAERAHDPGGYRALETVGISDRHHQLAHS